MSPATLLPESTFTVTPFERGPKDKYNFGAIVTGIDLNDISDDDVDRLRTAIWEHKVVVVKDQASLDPKKHWELVTRFDPKAPQLHSHGDVKSFAKKGGLLAKRGGVVGIPGAENVRLIGKGYQGADHYGIKDLTVEGLTNAFHAVELPDEEFQKGNTRFQRWHMDAPLFERDPAYFTTLRAVKLPKGPDMTINWDDGSELSMKTKPGRTAFFSNSQLYSLLKPEEQEMVDNSWVEYAPYPYMWIENCKGNSNGLGLATQGKEHKMEELPEFDPAAIKKYPFVWVNPVTGEKALQVHGICARRLFIKANPTAPEKIIEDVVEIRAFLSQLQSRILQPEYIFLAPVEEDDVGMWDNYGLFHSAIDYPLSYGSRTMHQANIGASAGPVGPRPLQVT